MFSLQFLFFGFDKLGRNTAHRLLRRKKQFPKSVHECGSTVLVHKPYEGDLHLLRIGSRIVTIFKHPKDILHNNIILHFDKLGNLFSNPRTEDGDVDFAEIDFFREMFREFGGFDAGKFFIFEPRVLKGVCAPHTSVCHGE